MNKVAIVRGTEPVEMTVKALRMSCAEQVLTKEEKILIKPNYINTEHPSTGITTDSRVIEGVVLFLQKEGIKGIVIGEGTGYGDTFEAFRVAGVDKVAERFGIRLVDLNDDEFVEVTHPHPLALKKVKIAKIALERTIISVPKLKPHRLAGVTLSLKNMMGAMTPKGSMHNRLSENIADLASLIKPRVAVIDGIVAGEGHETSGNPVQTNLVIAGTDPVSVDVVGAAVMEIPLEDTRHIRLADKIGLGSSRLEDIEVVGEAIMDVKRKFRTSFHSRFSGAGRTVLRVT